MSNFKKLLSYGLSFQLAFFSIPSLAKEQALSKEERRLRSQKMVHAQFDFVVHQSAIVQTLQDFEKYLLFGFKAADRRAILRALKDQKDFPTFQRVGDALIADNGLKRYELKWTGGVNQFELNGAKWSYEPTKPFMPQYEDLQNRLKEKIGAGFRLPRFLPEAEALAWLAPVALMVVSGAAGVVVADSANELWCAWDPWSSATCSEIRKKQEENIFRDAPLLDAVSNQAGTDNKNILAAYESNDFNCPTNNDGKDREYRGRLRRVETKDGSTKPISDWFNVVAKFNPQGLPTDLIITRGNSDPSTLDTASKGAQQNLVIHIAFDPTKKKPISYRMPNLNYNASRDLLGSPTVTLSPVLRLTPEQKESVEKAKDIVKYINYRNYNCVAKQVEAEQLAGVPTASPTQPGSGSPPPNATSPGIIK